MANENVIKVGFHISGLATVTAVILKPDGSVRDSQSAVALTDSGHVNSYRNAGAITIQTGDEVQAFNSGVFLGNGIFRPETSAVSLNTTIAAVTTPDTVFTLTDGSSDDDAYNNMVISVTDISGNDTRSRRVTSYVGSSKTVTVDADFQFSIVGGDIVTIWADTYSQTAGAAAIQDIADASAIAVWEEPDLDHIADGTKGQKMHFSGKGRY